MTFNFADGGTADADVIVYPDYSVEGIPLQPGDIREQDSISAPFATPGGSIQGSVNSAD